MTLVMLSAHAYTKPDHVPGYGPLSIVVRPSIVIEGSLSPSNFVPGKMNGYVIPAAARLQRGPQDLSVKIDPNPSELAENVNSLMNVGVNVLITLSAPVRFGRDHNAAKSVPSKGLLNCHGTRVPRRLMRCLLVAR